MHYRVSRFRQSHFLLFVAFSLFFLHLNSFAYALLTVGIDHGNVEPLPVAIDSFDGTTLDEREFGKELANVIMNDLRGSGLFRMIDRAAFLERPSVAHTPVFSKWRQINAVAVLAGSVEVFPQYVKLRFKIWDPYTEKQLDGMEYKISQHMWRKYAHKIADIIYQRITGDIGYFDTKIVFVAESGSATKKTKKLAIIDQDGANYKLLTEVNNLAMTPKFDPKNQRVVYTGYKNRKPAALLLDLTTGMQKLLGHFDGISFSPRFAPDNSHIAFSIAKSGTTNIYEFNLQSGYLRKLTNDVGAINTSPCYSPDGRQIVFESDRANSRQLYIMDRDGSNIRRISQGTGTYATPAWSPKGDFIAFIKKEAGTFYVGVMRTDGTGERLLTTSWLDEGPTWSPNGRVIMFSRRKPNGISNLYSIDLTGYNERLIPTPISASEPSWSSLLH